MSNTPEKPPQAFLDLKMAIEADTKREVEEIGRKAGVDRNTIWRWLDGQTRNPNIAEVDKVLRALGYKLEVNPRPPRVKPWRKR